MPRSRLAKRESRVFPEDRVSLRGGGSPPWLPREFPSEGKKDTLHEEK